MNNEVLHYATPLMRTPNLIRQRSILDHPRDSDVTMCSGRAGRPPRASTGDALKEDETELFVACLFAMLFVRGGVSLSYSMNLITRCKSACQSKSLGGHFVRLTRKLGLTHPRCTEILFKLIEHRNSVN